GAHVLGFGGEAGAVSGTLGPPRLIFSGGDDFIFALREKRQIEIALGALAVPRGKSIAADRAAIIFVKPPPTPAAKLRIIRIEGMPDPVVQGLVAGGDEHFASSPGEFVIVHELV